MSWLHYLGDHITKFVFHLNTAPADFLRPAHDDPGAPFQTSIDKLPAILKPGGRNEKEASRHIQKFRRGPHLTLP